MGQKLRKLKNNFKVKKFNFIVAQQSNFWPSGGGSEESIEKCFMHDWIEACNLQINLRSDGKLT